MGKGRIAGVFYLLTFLTGGFALVSHSRLGIAAGLIAGACYLAVTILFYGLFKPVNATLSLLAALVSLVGIVAGPSGLTSVNPLVFFGIYCLLIGYLIVRSTFLPRSLGGLMAFASLGWLTFLSPTLAQSLYPTTWFRASSAKARSPSGSFSWASTYGDGTSGPTPPVSRRNPHDAAPPRPRRSDWHSLGSGCALCRQGRRAAPQERDDLCLRHAGDVGHRGDDSGLAPQLGDGVAGRADILSGHHRAPHRAASCGIALA